LKAEKLAARRSELKVEKEKRDKRKTEMDAERWEATRRKNKAIRMAAAAQREELFDKHEAQLVGQALPSDFPPHIPSLLGSWVAVDSHETRVTPLIAAR